ncbi:MAG: PTS system trehalose-specific EIIBC component [Lachnospiraceae bacterium]|nr:PTS system trehalose-specific EIIBC component [Lachnospiraceae bacterium]
MGKYTEDSKQLLKLIGGKENIGAVSHCMTRMRFVLNDESKADIKGIEAMKVVKGTFTQAGQFQVIIGNTVSDFYNDFTAVAGVSGVSKDQVKAAAKKNQNIIQRIMTNIAEIFAPIIPALIVGGLILGFRNVIDSMYIFQGGHTLVELSQFWAGIDSFLWLIGEAIFHLGIPVAICWSVTRKMGTTQILGIILGLTLVSPQLLNAYSMAGTAAADIPKWDFGFAQVNMVGYQAQVIPAILAAFTLVYLEKFFRKITPSVISMIVVPFFSLLFAVMAAHFVLGPIGWAIGSAISGFVYAGISGNFRVVFGAIFGFFYAPLVITGLHHMSNAIDIQLANDFGGTMLWPMIALSNIAQGSAVLGMVYLQRKDEDAQEVNIPSMISCYLGVTEPAMFGVNLKYTFPFICGMIGSCIAGIISTAMSVTAESIGVGGLPGILSIQTPSILGFVICMAVVIVVPFVLTVIVGKKQGIDKAAAQAAADREAEKTEAAAIAEAQANADVHDIAAPLSGEVIELSEVNDGVFSAGMMGDGVAIRPTGETVVAPQDAEVSVVMDGSFHAVGLTLANGMEILIHVGVDTVNMQGKGFRCHVQAGDRVKKGDRLITFSKEEIKKAGYPDTTMVLVTDDNDVQNIRMKAGFTAEAGKENIMEW